MPISDELEALRQSSRVKTQSTRLSSAAASSTTILSPQQQEELRKAKLTQEKQSKLEAERALRLGATYNLKDSNNLLQDLLGNGLYGRLMNDHRRKAREAQKRLHEWKGTGSPRKGKNGDDSDDIISADGENIDNEHNKKDDEEDVDNDDAEEESAVISNAVEMLPDHIVQALKEKYETNSIEEALTKALKEEERGALSKVMMNAVSKKDGEENSNGNSLLPSQEKQEEEQQQQQQDEDEEEQQTHEEQQGETEEAKAEAEEEEPIEEVRGKIENLSINDAEVKGPAETAVTIEENVEVEESKETATITEQQSSPTKVSAATFAEDDLDCIEQTKLFYNKLHTVDGQGSFVAIE